jgi:uncharacterized protein YPO0396
MKYPQISALVPKDEFFDESAIGEGVYLTTSHLNAVEQALSAAHTNEALQTQLDAAVANNATLTEQVSKMHSQESVDALNAKIVSLEAENKELGKGASGNGTVVETVVDELETGAPKTGKSITDENHPLNQAVKEQVAAKENAKKVKSRYGV